MTTPLDVAWFKGRTVLAVGVVPPPIAFSLRKQNIAHFCPQCGEIWARIIFNLPVPWYGNSRLCDRCGPGFILPYDPIWLKFAPKEVLEHEIFAIAKSTRPHVYDIQLMFNTPGSTFYG